MNLELLKEKSHLKDPVEVELWYNRYIRLISYAKEQEQTKDTQSHHILPKSLFPEYKSEKKNLIKLSYRLHYLAHYILYRLINDSNMSYAFHIMSANKNFNSHLYSSSVKDLYVCRKNMTVATNADTGINEVVHTSKLNDTHIHTSVGNKWWTLNGDTIFTKIDLSDQGYTNTHNFKCSPSRVYWALDKGGKRYRTEDPRLKIKGAAPWQKGFNKINKETTRFLNLKSKEFEYVYKNETPSKYHYRIQSYNNKFIPVFEYENVYYFSSSHLPQELSFNLSNDLECVHNVIPTVDSYLYKHRKNKIHPDRRRSIENNGGLTLYELGLRIYDLRDPEFNFNFENSFYDFENRNHHI